ncbi:YndM family protein [Priestia koreensis]|uniref:YndM family protein n=1 Tax=Priestia koreensis TaxID=284581 RepID=UPI00203FD559|nr:YndM family protein [Priestia koreensis]MCM3004336.1 YndM family protein [Priestia koreensis]
MKHMTAVLVKFVAALIAFAVGLDLFFSATIVDIVTFAFIVTFFSYMLVERVILPKLGSMAATIVDFTFTYMSVWIFGSILLNNYMQVAWGSIISAVIVTSVEVFVHRYLTDSTLDERIETSAPSVFSPNLAYGTEFAEDHDMDKRALLKQERVEEKNEEKEK